jgi:hypothetical protein
MKPKSLYQKMRENREAREISEAMSRTYPNRDALKKIAEATGKTFPPKLASSADLQAKAAEMRDELRTIQNPFGYVHLAPHAELRKTWAPGQWWQVSFNDGNDWEPCEHKGVPAEPGWNPHALYRRHPKDTDQPKEKPWYPDDGEWVEVPDSLMTMPAELRTSDEIFFLLKTERSGASGYCRVSDFAGELDWDCTDDVNRIVAYRKLT